ncbi:hypothetical protein D047_2409B, partial [Vibrio parahaemolyticus VPTS-2010_2]
IHNPPLISIHSIMFAGSKITAKLRTKAAAVIAANARLMFGPL